MTDQIDADILLSQQLEHAARFLRGVSDEDADACERAAERISALSQEPMTSPLDLSALKAATAERLATQRAACQKVLDEPKRFTARDWDWAHMVVAIIDEVTPYSTALPALIKRVEELEAEVEQLRDLRT